MPDPTPLRIGYVLKRFPRFSETFILNELLALQSQGAKLQVFSLLTPPDEPRHARLADLHAPVTYLAKAPPAAAPVLSDSDSALFAGNDARTIATLHAKAAEVARLARAAGITHLHAHFGSDPATVALLAARALGGTFSFTAHARDIYHTYISPPVDAAKRQAKLREAAFTVTVSDFNATHLRALCPEAAQRIHRLYNGIDLSLFSPSESVVPGRILAVGRLVEKKGFVPCCATAALAMIARSSATAPSTPRCPIRSPRWACKTALPLPGLCHRNGWPKSLALLPSPPCPASSLQTGIATACPPSCSKRWAKRSLSSQPP